MRLHKRTCPYCLCGGMFAVLFMLVFFPLTVQGADNFFHMEEWSKTDGLPSDTINALAQSPEGYLWIGTSSGLVRYDGFQFSVIDLGESGQYLEPVVHELYFDREGALWVGSSIGLVHKTGRRSRIFSKEEGYPDCRVTCFLEDVHGSLWIGTRDHFLIEFKEGVFSVYDESRGMTGTRINSLFEDDNGRLLVGTSREGVFQKEKDRFIPLGHSPGDYLLYTLEEQAKGSFLLGTSSGLLEWTPEKTSLLLSGRNGLISEDVTSIVKDLDGCLWLGTMNGVSRVERAISGEWNVQNILNYNQINRLYRDREENIWIATNEAGLKRIRETDFNTLTVSPDSQDNILSLFQGNDGNIWAGTPLGLYRSGQAVFNEFRIPRTNGSDAGVKPNWIRSIHQDRSGNLWFGTASDGVFQVTSRGTVRNFTIREGLVSNTVLSILCDSKGNIWLGTESGLSWFHDEVFETFSMKDGLPSNRIQNLYEDSGGNILVLTDSGIALLPEGKFDPGKLTIWLTGISVTVIREGLESAPGKGPYWIGTMGQGLILFEEDHIRTFTEENGLPSRTIYQILEDDQERFWMSSPVGVVLVDSEVLHRLFEEKNKDDLECYLFGRSDGLKSVKCSEYGSNSAIRTDSGELWFATYQGIAVVDPSDLKYNKRPPPVVIEKYHIGGKEVPMEKKDRTYKVDYCMGIYFTAPTFISPEKIKFRYKLEGLDQEWIELPPGVNPRFAHYVKPPHGHYLFRVMACNSHGIWNRTGASFEFTVAPYYYQTTWFKIGLPLFLLLIVSGSFFLIWRYIGKRGQIRKYSHSSLTQENADRCLKQLSVMLDVDKIYLDSELSLNSLAERLSVPAPHLSQVINDKMQKNFFDMINSYRVKEAKQQLTGEKTREKSILDIAFDVGFNSQASFYRAFNKFAGCSPSEYRKQGLIP